jgi:hypothetical protein
MENKKPWQSKTILVNGVLGLAAFICLFWEGAAVVKPWVEANAMSIGMFWSVANIVLRAISKDKIGLEE